LISATLRCFPADQDYLFNLRVLGECSGVIDFIQTALFWWGEAQPHPAVRELDFDGGFSGTVPLGGLRTRIRDRRIQFRRRRMGKLPMPSAGMAPTAIRGRITQSAFRIFSALL